MYRREMNGYKIPIYIVSSVSPNFRIVQKLRFCLKMAEEGQVFAIHTIEAWKEILEKGNESKKLIVVDFTASWCGPCRIIAPVFSDLAKKITNVTFVKVDVDELASVAEEWKVEAMPTFVFVKEGKEIERIVGVKKEELVAKVEKHATDVAAA